MAKTDVRASGFTLPDMTGERRSLEDLLRGGPVVLAFFKVSCPTCQYTFPFLERLHEGFNKEFGVRFPVLLDSEDENYPVSNAYGITHVPTLFLIEPDGRVALTSQGWSKADLEEIGRRLGAANLFHRNERVEAFRAG